jgi:asparagine synthase (glutamine-hydrolysing)
MTAIGGLIYRDRHRVVAPPHRDALIPGAAAPLATLDDPGAALVTLGAAACAERIEGGAVVADLDLSNLEELLGLTAAASPGQAIRRLSAQARGDFPAQLRGAFAIALWLPAERRLVLATDRFGLRRLYYAVGDGGIAFSSRALGPLALPGRGESLDLDAVYAYMNFGTVPAPQTMYRAVRRLPPAHILVWHDGRFSVERYWDMAYVERPMPRDVAARAMFGHTEEAVRQNLVGADIKHTGAFLSGGTDSSTVVGLMSRLSGERVHAFSIGFREERYNELAYAQLAARHFDAAHYTQLVTPDEAFACVPDLVAAYGEPFGNNSVIPTYLCARLARETGMRLLLAGDGGDEIFGGNERYRREHILSRYGLIPWPLRRSVIEPLLKALPLGGLSPLGKAQRYVERASRPNPDRFYSSEFFVAQHRTRLLHPDFLAAVAADWPLQVARGHYRRAHATTELNRLLYVDLKITLADNDLFKVTQTAEAAGVAVRFPMLDPTLVAFTGTLPARYKVRGSEKRYLFKRAFADLLPAEILAKVKHGFGLPISDWLKTHREFRQLARDTLLSARCLARGYFATGALESLFRHHAEDRTPFYGDLLWTLLMLELWHRQHGERQ